MKRSIACAIASIRRLRRDRRGVTAMLVAVLAPILFAGAGVAIDVGRALQAQRLLQGASDAAAMAGAQYVIDNPTQAVASATTYSALSGNLNASANLTATMAPGYPALKCFKSTGILCGGTAAANAIVVKQQANVPTFFVNALGIKSIPIAATAPASASGTASLRQQQCGDRTARHRTASMNTNDPNCSNNTKIVWRADRRGANSVAAVALGGQRWPDGVSAGGDRRCVEGFLPQLEPHDRAIRRRGRVELPDRAAVQCLS